MSSPEQAKELVEQLRREAAVNRMQLSQTADEMKKFIEGRQPEDILVNGFTSAKDNPYKEKSSCTII